MHMRRDRQSTNQTKQLEIQIISGKTQSSVLRIRIEHNSMLLFLSVVGIPRKYQQILQAQDKIALVTSIHSKMAGCVFPCCSTFTQYLQWFVRECREKVNGLNLSLIFLGSTLIFILFLCTASITSHLGDSHLLE